MRELRTSRLAAGMSRLIACAMAPAMLVSCDDSAPPKLTILCPALPQVEGVCLGMTTDTLRQVRPGVFEDSHGPKEVDARGNPIGYYWKSEGTLSLSRLTAVQVELDSASIEGSRLAALAGQLASGMAGREVGFMRVYDPWVADSLDIPSIRWTGGGATRLLRLDSRVEALKDRRAKLVAFDSMSPPKHIGRWIPSPK